MTAAYVFTCSENADPVAVLTARLETTQESLRQAVASIDRLTHEREQVREKDARHSDLVTARNALYDEVVQLRRANQAHVQEIVALKARTLAAPNDQEDMAILGRFFKRLVARGRMLVTLETLARDSRSWARVEPERHWDCDRYPSDSRLGQILLGLTK